MPQLPQIISNQDPQAARRSIGAAQAPGLELARVGDAATDLGVQALTKQKQLAQSRQLMEAMSTSADAADQFVQEALADPNLDNTQLTDKVKEGLLQIHDTKAKSIKDAEVRLHYDQDFERLADTHLTNTRATQFKREVDNFNAGVETAIDKYVNLSAGASDQQADEYKARIQGILSNAVANHAKTKVEAQNKLETSFGQIERGQADAMVQNDPANAAALLRLGKWEHIAPVDREQMSAHADNLAQARKNDRDALEAKLAAAEAKRLKEEGDHAFAEDLALSDEGKLTHEQLAADRIKYSWGNESHVLFGAIDSHKDGPSDATTDRDVGVRIGNWPPTISIKELDTLHDSGLLNGQDWAKHHVALANKLHQVVREDKDNPTMTQQRAMAMANIRNSLGDTDAYPAAVSEANHQFATGTVSDPVAAGDGIIAKYKAGAVNIKPFNAALTKLKSAETAMNTTEFNNMIKVGLKGNPKAQPYLDARDKVLQEAQKAHRIIGADISGAPEGTRRTKDGKNYIILDGKVVLE